MSTFASAAVEVQVHFAVAARSAPTWDGYPDASAELFETVTGAPAMAVAVVESQSWLVSYADPGFHAGRGVPAREIAATTGLICSSAQTYAWSTLREWLPSDRTKLSQVLPMSTSP